MKNLLKNLSKVIAVAIIALAIPALGFAGETEVQTAANTAGQPSLVETGGATGSMVKLPGAQVDIASSIPLGPVPRPPDLQDLERRTVEPEEEVTVTAPPAERPDEPMSALVAAPLFIALTTLASFFMVVGLPAVF